MFRKAKKEPEQLQHRSGGKKKKKKRELTEIIFLNIWMDLGFPLLRLTEVQGWVCVPDPEEHHTVTAVCTPEPGPKRSAYL